MDEILKLLNYNLDFDLTSGEVVKLIVINNPDGTIRWFMPANGRKPYFLKFYAITGIKSRLFSAFSKLVFLFRLQGFVFPTKRVGFSPISTPLENNAPKVDLLSNSEWAVFTGTVGPNRKGVLFSKEKESGYFYKIATTPSAEELLKNEAAAMLLLDRLSITSFHSPSYDYIDRSLLKLEDVSINGKRSGGFEKCHYEALSELYSKTSRRGVFMESEIYKKSEAVLANLLSKGKELKVPNSLVDKMLTLRDSLYSGESLSAFCHGDFTQWNMFLNGDKLSIYDWELSENDIPIGFDAFHMIIQGGILVDRRPWKEIRSVIEERLIPLIEKWGGGVDWKEYLKYYLYINTIKYLEIYNNQADWHIQIKWLLSTWDEAVTDMISESTSHRRLLISDIFNFLKEERYATLKFPDIEPAELPITSDIDIVMDKELQGRTLLFIENHPLVRSVYYHKKSFMKSATIILRDESILSLDLINKLKWKWLVMQEVDKVLDNAKDNSFGVKQMNQSDTAQFLKYFYGLNQSRVPEKYHHILSLEYREFLSKEKPIIKKILMEELKQHPSNKGVNGLGNNGAYLTDTLKGSLRKGGIVITFSGVDGAGKSTIIENVKGEIDKRFRKEVVVIRHRPSLLPILSAWTKGKAKAEQEAASRLPRQGTNKSSIGSLIRFVYYYIDYFIGQFVVYFRYTVRGKVVLYDRYYFDFINDSRRSNIDLSPKFVYAWYKLLMQPHLNFFLYAKPEVILKRKQELDKETIEALTDKYLTLFNKLGVKNKERYYSIENNDLHETVEFILKQVKRKLFK